MELGVRGRPLSLLSPDLPSPRQEHPGEEQEERAHSDFEKIVAALRADLRRHYQDGRSTDRNGGGEDGREKYTQDDEQRTPSGLSQGDLVLCLNRLNDQLLSLKAGVPEKRGKKFYNSVLF